MRRNRVVSTLKLSYRQKFLDYYQKAYLYRAVDKHGQTIDFLLTEHRDERAAKRFLTKAIRRHGVPEKITAIENELGKISDGALNTLINRDLQTNTRHAQSATVRKRTFRP
jgi:transposase-like protein